MKKSIGTRQPLPNRRLNKTREIKWLSPRNSDGQATKIDVAVGFDPVEAEIGRFTPREIFYEGGYKTGPDMHSFLLKELCTPPVVQA